MFTAYGKISEVKPSPKGYTRLTVSHNVPFNTRHLKFNVWDQEHLQTDEMKPFKKNDTVFIEYSYKNGYPRLHKIEEKLIDSCPVCYSSLEALNAQRMECDGQWADASVIHALACSFKVDVGIWQSQSDPMLIRHSLLSNGEPAGLLPIALQNDHHFWAPKFAPEGPDMTQERPKIGPRGPHGYPK